MRREDSTSFIVETPDVIIQVSGLACPICARSVSSALLKLEGISGVRVQLDDPQEIRIRLGDGPAPSDEILAEAVIDGGFGFGTIRRSHPPSNEHD